MNKQIVLFIHGFVGHPFEFDKFNEYLTSLGYNTHRFLLSGHDYNGLNKCKYTDWINDCIYNLKLLVEQGYNEIIVIGHSMGGILATIIANKFPEYVKKIILLDIALEYLVMNNDKLEIIPSLKKSLEIIKDISKMEDSKRVKTVSLYSVNEFQKLNKKYKKEIYKVKCPILMIHGENDTLVPIDKIKIVYKYLLNKNKSFFEVKDGTHWFLHYDLGNDLKETIYNFIK